MSGVRSTVLAGLAVPVVCAPMAGGPSTPALATAVSRAGGLGFVAGAGLDVDRLAAQIETVRAERVPFGVNLFLPTEPSDADLTEHLAILDRWAAELGVTRGEPTWDDDGWAAKLAWLVAHPVPVVSFTFGCPAAADVSALQEAGTEVWVTVTSVDEARRGAAAGADALVVQGPEAGGHRGTFTNVDHADDPGLLELLDRVVRECAGVSGGPSLVAAGGLMTATDVAGVLAAGAAAAQLGTAFLRTPEAGTGALHRAALGTDRPTVVTRAISGRPARGIRTVFLEEATDAAPAAYPQLQAAIAPVRRAGVAAGDERVLSMWAGVGHAQAQERPAAEVVAALDPS